MADTLVLGAPTRTGSQFPIPVAILPQVAPTTYFSSHLLSSSPVRPSGRSPSHTRPISIHTGSLTNANGSALVRLGNTSVVCGVRAEILHVRDIANYRPSTDIGRGRRVEGGNTANGTTANTRRRPADGNTNNPTNDEDDDSDVYKYSLLVPNIELQTGASPLPAYQPSSGAPSALAQSLSQRLFSTIRTTHLVQTKDLEIYGSELPSANDNTTGIPDILTQENDEGQELKGYWTLYIDVLVLSHDGSLFDVALTAVLAALRDAKLPRAWFDADRDHIVCSPSLEVSKTLGLGDKAPVALSWRVFVDDEDTVTQEANSSQQKRRWILLDPDALEEDSGACREGGTIVVDRPGSEVRILKLEKHGGPVVGVDDLKEITREAGERWKDWNDVLDQAVVS